MGYGKGFLILAGDVLKSQMLGFSVLMTITVEILANSGSRLLMTESIETSVFNSELALLVILAPLSYLYFKLSQKKLGYQSCLM